MSPTMLLTLNWKDFLVRIKPHYLTCGTISYICTCLPTDEENESNLCN